MLRILNPRTGELRPPTESEFKEALAFLDQLAEDELREIRTDEDAHVRHKRRREQIQNEIDRKNNAPHGCTVFKVRDDQEPRSPH